ncbi:MAG TPA: 16S rRNA (adenine(1518)-N(6)/adenine(1519)-N(6))-dimethyltransferase RsmA [Acidobacteriaceae bacterium]|nr:16S rRNA (adenine(1518)-N(6)/adenine(1519)-N(6))-dimethyltransferase RsmA [Acidobacteriaceae bacterium]
MSQKKPKLGQNFLTDPRARQRIVEALGDISCSTVLEIGPGRGALTDLLASRAQNLVAVELDRALAPRLTEKWKSTSHVAILQADILELDLENVRAMTGSDGHAPLVVVGNLPYYITSDILLHLFAQAASISRAVVMVQEEVADRLAAIAGTSAYGVLSATAQMHGHVEKLFALPPEAFSPAPGVSSAVVRLEMHPRFEELHVERSAFLRFLQLCFRQKRKTLANNLKNTGIADTARILAAIEKAGLRADVRAEAVSLEPMALIFRWLHAKNT